jgi:hypothetical protein
MGRCVGHWTFFHIKNNKCVIKNLLFLYIIKLLKKPSHHSNLPYYSIVNWYQYGKLQLIKSLFKIEKFDDFIFSVDGCSWFVPALAYEHTLLF